ncbi:pyruvate/2-oxoglutarate dehydrogenase complex dihydrolipoamide dehydrogenase (E3) component [Modestobacter roseus]|uniref:Pyruvate/2-oxoglutarate dehydrogenase complex dihydrolipoamide dehydrogenase (E3) component n=1 Tax=Modestobacter roseus TaxID=1181884 RepID=A0A562IX48_9ACTN|nr:pyruvate/2-oxoglutarate dehydrogenase complex dihydrolipoamide dehydrogenase (E3) component [Modestobacter roseus]
MVNIVPDPAGTVPDTDVRRRRWELLVVGAGTAGLLAAQTAASFGVRVLLVDRGTWGGECLWTGCVPSKALIAAGEAAAAARGAAEFGVHADGVRIDGAAVLDRVREAVRTIEPVDSPRAQRDAGIAVATGDLVFTGPDAAELDGHRLRFRQAVVATGSAPSVPPVPGLAEAGPLTTETLWDEPALPGRLVVLGGGTTGCELGQAMARLGVDVHLVETADRLLPAEDPAASGLVTAALERDGVTVHLGAEVRRVTGGPGSTRLALADGSELACDRVLVATGRRAARGRLGLAAAGVACDEAGWVTVDRHLRTSNPRIWAAGDVTGQPPYTHLAGLHGSTVAANAVLGLRRTVDLTALPRVTFTQPEVAAVGAPTGSAGEAGLRVVEQDHRHADRAITDRRTDGVTRLAVDSRHRVRGATVVGPRAGETLAELTLAVTQGLTTSDLTGATHPYPTYADPVWQAAIGDYRARLAAPVPRRALRALRRLRRLRLALPG